MRALKHQIIVSLALVFGIAGTFSSSAAPGWKRLRDSVPPVVSRLISIGQLAANTNLSLAIGLPLRNEAALDELLGQLYDPKSTNFHKFLTAA